MINRYPLWKYLLILTVAILGFIYAAPNLYRPDPAVQLSGSSLTTPINQQTLDQAITALKAANIEYFGEEVQEKSILIRLRRQDQQLAAKEAIQFALKDNYIVALNLAPTTPKWLLQLAATPMKLGLDLSGGVHFLLEVDIDPVIETRLKSIQSEIKTALREDNIRYQQVILTKDQRLLLDFRNEELRQRANNYIGREFPQLIRQTRDETDSFTIEAQFSELEKGAIEDYAVGQNITTLRNRVNELGVSEPIVQRQGRNRIVVELPGVQDTSEAKRILGKNANLEFRLEAEPGALISNKEKFEFRNSAEQDLTGGAFLERKVIITGENVANAQPGFDESSRPQVNITLDSQGGSKMNKATRRSIGRRMGVLFIEYKEINFDKDGKRFEQPLQIRQEKIINLATVQSALGVQFRITGLDSSAEASELALLLRAGALAAPIRYVQENTIGPSLGDENIALGIQSVQLGLLLVVLFMLFYYKIFGLMANIALAINLVLLIACLSILGATLTLPGIAGIVLTLGMAVDANVLIFSRIKEELSAGASIQNAIHSGYQQAFTTILDANLTTLIVAVILYVIGTGPIKGFAVTLSLGIVTSMLTAIVGSRALVNLFYGNRHVNKLSI